jgi:hypothetical protein
LKREERRKISRASTSECFVKIILHPAPVSPPMPRSRRSCAVLFAMAPCAAHAISMRTTTRSPSQLSVTVDCHATAALPTATLWDVSLPSEHYSRLRLADRDYSRPQSSFNAPRETFLQTIAPSAVTQWPF